MLQERVDTGSPILVIGHTKGKKETKDGYIVQSGADVIPGKPMHIQEVLGILLTAYMEANAEFIKNHKKDCKCVAFNLHSQIRKDVEAAMRYAVTTAEIKD